MPLTESERVQVRLNLENSEAVRKLSIEEHRSLHNMVDRLVAESLLKRAIHSLPAKKAKR